MLERAKEAINTETARTAETHTIVTSQLYAVLSLFFFFLRAVSGSISFFTVFFFCGSGFGISRRGSFLTATGSSSSGGGGAKISSSNSEKELSGFTSVFFFAEEVASSKKEEKTR